MKSPIYDHGRLVRLIMQVSLGEHFECWCQETYWILSKIDHGFILSIFGENKVF